MTRPSDLRRRALAGAAAVAALAGTRLDAQPGALDVGGQSNPFYAGLAAPAGDGQLPPSFTFAAGTGKVLTFSLVDGLVNCCGGAPGTPPDGDAVGQSVAGLGGLSGYAGPRRLPLLGVFLAGGAQPVAAPPTLDFDALGTDFASLAPLLGQVFFVGNGRTGGGVPQQFHVPTGATHLYLGIPDACGFNGTPTGCYADNTGAFRAEFTVSAGAVSSVPEPGSVALVGTGLAVLGAAARRRARAAA